MERGGCLGVQQSSQISHCLCMFMYSHLFIKGLEKVYDWSLDIYFPSRKIHQHYFQSNISLWDCSESDKKELAKRKLKKKKSSSFWHTGIKYFCSGNYCSIVKYIDCKFEDSNYKTVLSRLPLIPSTVMRVAIPSYVATSDSPMSHF